VPNTVAWDATKRTGPPALKASTSAIPAMRRTAALDTTTEAILNAYSTYENACVLCCLVVPLLVANWAHEQIIGFGCRENSEAELKGHFARPEERKAMKNILKRLHMQQDGGNTSDNQGALSPESESSEEDALEGVSAEGIAAFVAGGDVDVSTLPEADQVALQQALERANMAALIAVWQPWWLRASAAQIRVRRDGTRLVKMLPDIERGSASSSGDTDAVCAVHSTPGGTRRVASASTKNRCSGDNVGSMSLKGIDGTQVHEGAHRGALCNSWVGCRAAVRGGQCVPQSKCDQLSGTAAFQSAEGLSPLLAGQAVVLGQSEVSGVTVSSVEAQAECTHLGSRQSSGARIAAEQDNTDASVAQGMPPPPPLEPCVPLATLCAVPASPRMLFVLVQLLCAYCYAMRLYNGDADSDASEWLRVVWHLCPFLCGSVDQHSLLSSVAEVLERLTTQLRLPPVSEERARLAVLALVHDVATVLSAGRGAVLCACAHVARRHKTRLDDCGAACRVVVTGAAGEGEGARDGCLGTSPSNSSDAPVHGNTRARRKKGGRKMHSQQLQDAGRKMTFLMSFVNEMEEAMLARLQEALLAYHEDLQQVDGAGQVDVSVKHPVFVQSRPTAVM
jgi:hypothetical protein